MAQQHIITAFGLQWERSPSLPPSQYSLRKLCSMALLIERTKIIHLHTVTIHKLVSHPCFFANGPTRLAYYTKHIRFHGHAPAHAPCQSCAINRKWASENGQFKARQISRRRKWRNGLASHLTHHKCSNFINPSRMCRSPVHRPPSSIVMAWPNGTQNDLLCQLKNWSKYHGPITSQLSWSKTKTAFARARAPNTFSLISTH